MIAGAMRDRDGAVELLRQAFAGGHDYLTWVARDVRLAPLREYEPFEELMRPKG